MILRTGSLLFRFRPLPTLVCLLFIVLFLGLSRWQWQRADYKEQLHRQYVAGERAAPLTVAEASALGPRLRDVAGFPVVLAGRFDVAHTLLLDNQVENGMPGFQVFTPLRTVQGETVLVDRGWLPMGSDRHHFTPVPELGDGEFALRGRIYLPSERQFVLKEDDYAAPQWPLLVQKLDLARTGKALGVELAPFVVRLDPDVRVERGEQLPRHWQFIVITAEKSRGYAFQWLGMALVLLGFTLYFSLEKGSADE